MKPICRLLSKESTLFWLFLPLSICGVAITGAEAEKELKLPLQTSVGTGKPVFFDGHMGVYLQSSRLGSASITLEPVGEDSAEENPHPFRYEETLSIPGAETESVAFLRKDSSLGRFQFQFQGMGLAGSEVRCTGEVKDGTLEVEVHSEGSVSRREFPLDGPCFLSSSSHLTVLLHPFEKGTQYDCMVFDPMTQALSPMTFEILQTGQREALEETFDAAEVRMVFQGIEQVSWIAKNGLRLEDNAMDGMMSAQLESPQEAAAGGSLAELLSSSGLMLELVDRFKVELEGDIPSPRDCRRLLVEVSGISPQDVAVDGYWQTLEKSEENDFCLRIEHRPKPAGKDETREFLAPTFLVQADAPEIKQQAKKIVAGCQSDREKAEKLVSWVYDHLDRSQLRMTIPSAVEVLKSRKGDCNEHATLLAALGRAAGMPTKICTGAMYVPEGFTQGFYYHAWNEFYIEDYGWLPVDSAFNQTLADATHLKIVEGDLDKQAGVIKAVGKLQLKVVESGR